MTENNSSKGCLVDDDITTSHHGLSNTDDMNNDTCDDDSFISGTSEEGFGSNNNNDDLITMLLTQEVASPSVHSKDSNNFLLQDPSSSSENDSDDDENDVGPTFTERVAMKRQRNQDHLESIGFPNKKLNEKKKRKQPMNHDREKQPTIVADNVKENDCPSYRNRGMLLQCPLISTRLQQRRQYQQQRLVSSSNNNCIDSKIVIPMTNDVNKEDRILQQLYDEYPGRQHEINKLCSLLSSAASLNAIYDSRKVPPPVFVTGSSGTGKSAIVRSVVQSVQFIHNDSNHKNNHNYSTNNNQNPDHLMASAESKSGTKNRSINAYINCGTTFDSHTSNITGVMNSIYNQLDRALFLLYSNNSKDYSNDNTPSRRRRHLTNQVFLPKEQNTNHSENDKVNGMPTYNRRQKMNSEQNDSMLLMDDNDKCNVDDDFENGNDNLKRLDELEAKQVKKQQKNGRLDGIKSMRSKGTTASAKTSYTKDSNNNSNLTCHQSSNSGKEITAVWKLGNALRELFHEYRMDYDDATDDYHDCSISAILVLDHAELLLTSSTTTASSSPSLSFLSQLLLLPQTIGFNLTIVIVTNSISLEHTGLNNLCSRGTIAGHMHPIRIHFPVYRGKVQYKKILAAPNVQRLITGNLHHNINPTIVGSALLTTQSVCRQIVYKSFLDTIVQSLLDYTTDIKEYIRLARVLWPRYIEPLSARNIDETIQAVIRKKLSIVSSDSANVARKNDVYCHEASMQVKVQNVILELLDRRIHPVLKTSIERGLFVLAPDSQTIVYPERKQRYGSVVQVGTSDKRIMTSCTSACSKMPILIKYLLLAAYICQVNRADKDRHLFSIRKNGKNKRKRFDGDDNQANPVSIQGDRQALHNNHEHPSQHIKSLRPRAFPFERLLSVFVSIVGLNANIMMSNNQTGQRTNDSSRDEDEILRTLGTVQFNESLAYIRSIGILNASQSDADQLRTGQMNYWCSLKRDEAQDVARSVDFPLERYILS